MSTSPHVDAAWFGRPCLGHTVSGDAAVIDDGQDGLFVALLDVLGHGAEAHDAAQLATRYLTSVRETDLIAVIDGLHVALRGSRGAAAVVANLQPTTGRLQWLGVGNVVARVAGPTSRRLSSKSGIIGERLPRRLAVEAGVLSPGDTLILYSDGIGEHPDPIADASLLSLPARRLVRTIVQSRGKLHDDATCLVANWRP